MNRRGFLGVLIGVSIGLPRLARSSPVGDIVLGVDMALEGSDTLVITFLNSEGKILGTTYLGDEIAKAFSVPAELMEGILGTTFGPGAGRTLVDGFHQLSPWGVKGNRGGGGELVDGSMASGRDSGWWKPSTRRPPTNDKLLKNIENSHGIHPPPVHQLETGPYAEASRTVAPRRGAYRLACGKVRSE